MITLKERPDGHAYYDGAYVGETRRYTAVVKFPGNEGDPNGHEEIDVDAEHKAHANDIVLAVLQSGDYEPGGVIIAMIGPRVGLYL